jgi:hypothetical protein
MKTLIPEAALADTHTPTVKASLLAVSVNSKAFSSK